MLASGEEYWKELTTDFSMRGKSAFITWAQAVFGDALGIHPEPINDVATQNKLVIAALISQMYMHMLSRFYSRRQDIVPVYDSPPRCSFELHISMPFSESNDVDKLEGELKEKINTSIVIKDIKQGEANSTILICTCDATDEWELPFDWEELKDNSIGEYNIPKKPTLDGYIVGIQAPQKDFEYIAKGMGYIEEGPFWTVTIL